MRTVFGMVLVVGLALAGFAVFMTQRYFSQSQAELNFNRELRAKTGPLVQIYVVNKVKKYGETLTKDDVQQVYWQESALPDHAFQKDTDLFPENIKDLRFISRQIEKFEPILSENVTEPGKPSGLTSTLEKGETAFAVKVDVASGVAGFVQVGDRVDIYWTGSASGSSNANGSDGEMTRLIETGVRVVGVDQQSDNNATTATVARTVTLAAMRQDVARLTQAQATGRLNLALVGTTDTTVAGKIEVNSNQLLGITPQEAAPAAVAAKVCSIKMRKGADVVDAPIPCTN